MMDHKPELDSAKHARERHMDDLASAIVETINQIPECFRIDMNGSGFNMNAQLTPHAAGIIADFLKENT